jgi:hypothetical protein
VYVRQGEETPESTSSMIWRGVIDRWLGESERGSDAVSPEPI